MLENFYIAVNAVVPMFILICIGSLIKRLKLMTPEEIKHMNKTTDCHSCLPSSSCTWHNLSFWSNAWL